MNLHIHAMSRYIVKSMNLNLLKQPTIWNGGCRIYSRLIPIYKMVNGAIIRD